MTKDCNCVAGIKFSSDGVSDRGEIKESNVPGFVNHLDIVKFLYILFDLVALA